jgi:glycosyltransferase involved in cell wall biosynthesis
MDFGCYEIQNLATGLSGTETTRLSTPGKTNTGTMALRLTIALDATYGVGDQLSGVGLYSHEILWGLAAAHPEVRFHFAYRPHRYFRSWALPLPRNVRRRPLIEPFSPRGAALFHGLNQRLPDMALRRAVATFHDLFVMTGEYSTPEFRARFTAQARDAAERADAIIAVSEFTRQQVISLLGVAPSKVRVVHHGTRALAFPAREREKVILNVGAMQTRKNIARLVEAFETLEPGWRLVLAGSSGYGSGEILRRIANSPAQQRITVTGYVTPGELASWYAKAEIFAFPSLDEGFGMPLLEAMAAGTPVIASNRSALPEVAGDAAILVDPESVEAIGQALRNLTHNEDLRRDLARRGTARARLFTWDKAVEETWNVYKELLG